MVTALAAAMAWAIAALSAPAVAGEGGEVDRPASGTGFGSASGGAVPGPPSVGGSALGAQQPTAESLVRIDVFVLDGPDGSAGAAGAAAPGARDPQQREIAVVFDVAPRWHIYWRNAGDSGLPPEIAVASPKGWKVERVRWPRPSRFRNPYETTYGYEGGVALLVTLAPSAEAGASQDELALEVSYMVCRDVCLTGRAQRRVSLSAPARPGPREEEIIARSAKRLPAAPGSAAAPRVALAEGALVIEGPLEGAAQADFFPLLTPGVSYGEPALVVRDGRYRIAVPLQIEPGNALGEPLRAAGLVTLGGPDDPSFEFTLPIAAP